tara:strand:- start:713 stop:1054 length:342 start_codon:yes stop_codon:yes gene_type:complete
MELKEEVDNTLLDREKILAINEASFFYNKLVEMASPEYYTEMEESAIRHIGREWNEIIQAENEIIKEQFRNNKEYGGGDISYNIDDDLDGFLRDLFKDIGENYKDLFDKGEEE